MLAVLYLVWTAWLFALLCVLCAIVIPPFRPVLAYGKLQLASNGVIPQHLFWPAIYAIGLIGNSVFAVLLLMWSASPTAYSLLILLFIHLTRRLSETILVHRFSRRFVQPLHALLGPSYYLGVTMGPQIEELVHPHSLPNVYVLCAGLLLFVWASYQQFASHCILASLRDKPGENSIYRVPSGGLFNYISSPHYAAEILIYAALVILTGAQNMTILLIFAFVVLTLGNGALSTHKWYKTRFPSYPRTRVALIPSLL